MAWSGTGHYLNQWWPRLWQHMASLDHNGLTLTTARRAILDRVVYGRHCSHIVRSKWKCSHHFTDNISKYIFLNVIYCVFIQISHKFVELTSSRYWLSNGWVPIAWQAITWTNHKLSRLSHTCSALLLDSRDLLIIIPQGCFIGIGVIMWLSQ